MRRAFAALFAGSVLIAACVGTTGSDLVTFHAYAAGPTDADPTAPLTFRTGRGYQVTLNRAVLHVGGVYLDRVVPVSGAQDTSCVLPGAYVAQQTEGLDVDTLSPSLQAFPGTGEGTETEALAGEIWLTGGDVNSASDTTVILDVAGTAEKSGYTIAFSGKLTIGQNRALTPTDPSLPGADPICKQRIVSPILTHVTPENGGYLVVRVDPRPFFANVDLLDGFKTLPPAPASLTYEFSDDETNETQPDLNLYQGMRAAGGVYSFSWVQLD